MRPESVGMIQTQEVGDENSEPWRLRVKLAGKPVQLKISESVNSRVGYVTNLEVLAFLGTPPAVLRELEMAHLSGREKVNWKNC